MAVVTGGLGQPDEGSLVAAGLGASTPAAPGGISAALVGTGSLAGTLSTGSSGAMVAALAGAGTLTASLTTNNMVATLTGAGSLTANLVNGGVIPGPLRAALPGTGSVTARLDQPVLASAALAGTGSVTAILYGEPGDMSATLVGRSYQYNANGYAKPIGTLAVPPVDDGWQVSTSVGFHDFFVQVDMTELYQPTYYDDGGS